MRLNLKCTYHQKDRQSFRVAPEGLEAPSVLQPPTSRASHTRLPTVTGLCQSFLAKDLHWLLSSVLCMSCVSSTQAQSQQTSRDLRGNKESRYLPLKKLSILIPLKYTTEQEAHITQSNYMCFLVIMHKLLSLSQGRNIKRIFFKVELSL